jgi:hypothetical protein
MVQHSIDQELGIRENPWFTDRLVSGNLDHRVSRPDVLHDMMVGSWPCKVSSEIHINGQHVSELVREDKGKMSAMELEDEKDPKRAYAVLSKGREVVRPGYLGLMGAAAKVTDS